MLGLVHYSDDSDADASSPRQTASRTAPTRQTAKENDVPASSDRLPSNPPSRVLRTTVKPPTPVSQRKTVTGVRLNSRRSPSNGAPQGTTLSNNATSDSMQEAGPSVPRAAQENITQIPQEVLENTKEGEMFEHGVDRWDIAYRQEFGNMSEDEIFKIVSRPPEIPGVDNWGIPPPPTEKPSAALQAKVANFLKLKVEQDRHINTTLLSSTAFANPHIYSKLVEFVDIDERGSAFPGGGWITRRGLESRIPDWGPKALAAQQKAQETALLAAQTSGKRKNIDFTSGSLSGKRNDSSSSRKDDRYSLPLPRNATAESSSNRRDSREHSVNGEKRDGEGASRRRDLPTMGERSLGRYERNRDREGKRKDKERRWD